MLGLVRPDRSRQLLIGGPDAGRLVNGNLLMDGQVHGHMQEGIRASLFHTVIALVGLGVFEFGSIFRVLLHDACSNGLQRRKYSPRLMTCPGVSEKLPDLFARWIEHMGSLPLRVI